ncbi:MAG: nitroreductase family protein [Bacteroidales bacterium]|nr:nitroreductase family protein [Bacteroidales bacterium]
MNTFMKIGLMAVVALMSVACCSNQESVNPGNAAIANIMNRKSVRSFTGEEVTPAQLEVVLKAAMAAPTAMNYQPWEFVVVNDKDKIAEVFGGGHHGEMYTNAGAVVVVCGNTVMMRKPRGQENAPEEEVPNQFWYEDCGAATENLLLAVEAQGLGAVWISCYPIEGKIAAMREAFALPENIMPFAIVPIGHPAGDDQPKDKWKPEKIHYNSF